MKLQMLAAEWAKLCRNKNKHKQLTLNGDGKKLTRKKITVAFKASKLSDSVNISILLNLLRKLAILTLNV